MDSAERSDSEGEIRVWLEGLRGQDLTEEDVTRAVQRLLAWGPTIMPLLLEQFATEDEALLAVATKALMVWETPDPVKPLLDLLKSPEISDLSKALILNILEHRGLDVNDPAVFGLAINLEDFVVEPGRGGNGTVQEP